MGGLGGPVAQGEEDGRQAQETFTENPLVAEHVGYGQGTNPALKGLAVRWEQMERLEGWGLVKVEMEK